jgi:hypothetical protein
VRIFLSYAAEQVAVAERLRLALGNDGHRVFFAHQSIPHGTAFDSQIRQGVRRSDLFIFLISPESVEPGSYCRTELGFAMERWPQPSGRVLPILVAPTPRETIPAYLQSISAMAADGNLVAEVVAAVERLARSWRFGFIRTHPIAVSAVVLATVSLGSWAYSRKVTAALPFLEVASIVDFRPEIAGEPAEVHLGGRVVNPGATIDSVTAIRLEVKGGPARVLPRTDFVSLELDASGGANFAERYTLAPSEDDERLPEEWRTCIVPGRRTRSICGPWNPWPAEWLATKPLLDRGIRQRARVVGAGGGAFFVGLAAPAELVTLRLPGDTAARIPLPGEPTVIVTRADRVAIGTRAPGKLVVIGLGPSPTVFDVPGGTVGGSQTSTEVASIALTNDEAWVITGGVTGDAALRVLDLATGRWTTPPYGDDRFEFDARGMRLRAGAAGEVWGVTAETTPSSLYRLTRSNVVETKGHDVSAVSCARDLQPLPDDAVLLVSCEGRLLRGKADGGQLTILREHDGRVIPLAKGDWDDQLISGPDTSAVAVTVLANDPGHTDQLAVQSLISWIVADQDRAAAVFRRDSMAVTSLAVRGSHALAVVKSKRGRHDIVQVANP